MPSTLPPYPSPGDKPWNTQFEARVDAVQSIADKAAAVVDAGGNIIAPFGSTMVLHSPDGSLWQQSISNAGTVTWTKVGPSDPLPGGGGTVPVNDDPNLLTIGAHTHAINGTNIFRDIDYMVRYTYSTAQTVTPTNMYGVEVVVNATTNVVVSVNNRLASSSTPGTPIGSGQYVLSGHGVGTGLSGQFLLDYATVGATLALSGNGGGSTGGGTGTQPPPGVTSAIFAYWYQVYRPPKINAISSSAMAKVNQINIALCQAGQNGSGKLYLPIPNGTNATTRAEVTTQVNAWRTAGKNVLMTFGGSSDGGITITNNTQAKQTFDDLVVLKEGTNPINFNGIDVDMEPSGSSWTIDGLTYLITLCKQYWGANFMIQLTPGLYYPYTSVWQDLIRRLLPLGYVDIVSAMMYDNVESTTVSGQQGQINGVVSALRAAGLPDSKIMLAYMLQPNSGYNASPIAVINSTVQWARTQYPSINKFILWEHSIDSDNGYPVATGPVPGYLGL